MQSLGLPDEDIKLFCSDNLFPIVSENQPYLEIIIINIPEKGITNGRTSNKREFKTICLRALGKAVIEINVDDDQLEDRIDEAMQYFTQYHYDGVKRTYLKYQYTQADKDRMTGDSTESATVGSVNQ